METPSDGTEGQAPPVPSPQAGTQTSQADPETPTEPTLDAAVLKRELDEARRETARYRTEAKKSGEALKAKEEEQLSELEKANKRIAELEQRNKDLETQDSERRLHVVSMDAAARLGFRSPAVAFKLLDRADVQFNDDGEPTNVEELLKKVLEREPYLAKPATPGDFGGGQRGASPPTSPDMDTLIKRAARG